MTAYRVVGSGFVCLVETDTAGVIRFAAPLLQRFTGQPLANLRRWTAVQSVERI